MAIGTPVLLNSGNQNTAVTTQITGTFDVTAGDIILAMCRTFSNFGTAYNHTLSSTTMSVSGWTAAHRQQVDGGGWSTAVSAFLTRVTSTQTGRTITFGLTQPTKDEWDWAVVRIPGATAAATFRQTFPGGVSNSGSTCSIALSGLAAGSIVVGVISDTQDDEVTPGAGWTELFDASTITTHGFQVQYDLTPADPCNWSALSVSGTYAALALEIAADAAALIATPTLLTSGNVDTVQATLTTAPFDVLAGDTIFAVVSTFQSGVATAYGHTLAGTTMTIGSEALQIVHNHTATGGGGTAVSTFHTRVTATQTGRTITFGVSPNLGFWHWAVVRIRTTRWLAQQILQQNKTATGTTLAISLTNLLPDSMVIAVIKDAAEDAITAGSGWTQLFHSAGGLGRALQVQYSLTPVSPCDWSSLSNAANTCTAIALEFEPMKIYLGSRPVDALYFGSTPVGSVYVGSNRVMGPPVASAPVSGILFRSGFETATVLSGMTECGPTSCWKNWSGTDASTSQAWPPSIWGGGGRSQQIADTSINATTILNYLDHTIITDTGHDGGSTKMSYQILKQPSPGSALQSLGLLLQPNTGLAQTDMYISMWLKFNTGFAADMGNNGWRSFFAWKTGGDFRVEQYVYTNSSGVPFWYMQGDNNANDPTNPPYQQYWENSNTAVAVPNGTWFQYEIAWHRSAVDGWIWAKVNGTQLYLRNHSLIGENNLRIDRIMLSLVYGDVTRPAVYPMEQWCDDIVIRDGPP